MIFMIDIQRRNGRQSKYVSHKNSIDGSNCIDVVLDTRTHELLNIISSIATNEKYKSFFNKKIEDLKKELDDHQKYADNTVIIIDTIPNDK